MIKRCTGYPVLTVKPILGDTVPSSLNERKGVTTIESYKSIRATHDGRVENKAETHEASRVG